MSQRNKDEREREMGFEFLDTAIPLTSLELEIRASICPPRLGRAWLTSFVLVMESSDTRGG